MSAFPCSGCGLCCKVAGRAVEAARKMVAEGATSPYIIEVANFPYHCSATGSCSNLAFDGSCTIYETRPDICKVDVTWEKYHKERVSKADYFKAGVIQCNSLILEAQLPDRFLIPM